MLPIAPITAAGTLIIAAGVGDFISFIVPILAVIIYAIHHLVTAAKGAPPPQPTRKPKRPDQAGRPQPPRQPEPVSNQGQLNDEIEQFLRRANERRNERSRREPATIVPQATPPTKGPKAPPRTPPKPPQAPVQPTLGDSQRRDFSNVADSVEKHLSNRGFEQRAEHLADDIVRADQQMEQHLQQAFGRRVGTLGDATSGASAEPVTDAPPTPEVDPTAAATAIRAILANPQSIKHAMILNEILQPPRDRW